MCPDQVSFNCVLRACSSRHMWEASLSVATKMQELAEPDPKSFNAVCEAAEMALKAGLDEKVCPSRSQHDSR